MKSFALILLTLFALSLSAQNTKTFVLDLAENEIRSSNNLKKCELRKNKLSFNSNDLVVFHIKNINPFKYNYSLGFKEINLFENYELDMDALFENMKNINGADILEEADKNKNLKDLREMLDKPNNDSLIMTIIVKHADELNSLFQDLEQYFLGLKSLESINMEELKKSRTKFFEEYKKLLYQEYLLEKLLEKKPVLLSSFNEVMELSKSNYHPKIEAVLKKLYSVNTDLLTLPIDVNGKNIDAIEISVQRTLIDSENQPKETYVYNLWTKGTLKIDVSGGIFITSLMDKEYFAKSETILTDDQIVTRQTISEKKLGLYDFGFGTTTHVYWTMGASKVTPGFNFGALLTSNQRFQFLLGGSLIFGKMERVILQGGLTMGSVSRLGNGYIADGTTLYDIGSDGNIPVYNQFNFGHYFGITYNFSKPKIEK
jgi:hypothetical protein